MSRSNRLRDRRRPKVRPTLSGPPIRYESFNTTRGRCTLAYQVLGIGPPLILIHGLAGSGRWWSKNIAAFSRHFRVYVVDLVGFGHSHSGRYEQGFSLGDAADVLIRFMDRVAIRRSSVVGHSMGGHIALVLAADTPDRIDRLVLVDAAALPLGRGRPGHLMTLLVALFRFPLGFLPVLAIDSWRAGVKTIWHAAREVLEADIRPKLGQVTSPTLVIWGERDTIVPVRLGHQLAERLPNASLLIIPGAGHNPMWERAHLFNQTVLGFLGANQS
jgi:pimeloyl-ACP methyl ester carboxylesterase